MFEAVLRSVADIPRLPGRAKWAGFMAELNPVEARALARLEVCEPSQLEAVNPELIAWFQRGLRPGPKSMFEAVLEAVIRADDHDRLPPHRPIQPWPLQAPIQNKLLEEGHEKGVPGGDRPTPPTGLDRPTPPTGFLAQKPGEVPVALLRGENDSFASADSSQVASFSETYGVMDRYTHSVPLPGFGCMRGTDELAPPQTTQIDEFLSEAGEYGINENRHGFVKTSHVDAREDNGQPQSSVSKSIRTSSDGVNFPISMGFDFVGVDASWQISVCAGERLRIELDHGDGWVEVKTVDGRRGCIPRSYIYDEGCDNESPP